MGIISEFMNSLNTMYIVTEADDITGDISSQTDDIMGNDEDTNTSEDPGDIDTNTDDILGTKTDGNNDTEPDNENTSDEDGQSSDSDDLNLDDDSNDQSNDSDISNPSDPESQDDSQDDQFTDSRKKKIKKQFMHLYDVINNSIKLISSYTPNVVDSDYVKVSSSIKDNLSQCKEIIYDLAVDNFQNIEYHELLKKYVAINRIYELSIRSMEKYFDNKNKNDNKQGKSNA